MALNAGGVLNQFITVAQATPAIFDRGNRTLEYGVVSTDNDRVARTGGWSVETDANQFQDNYYYKLGTGGAANANIDFIYQLPTNKRRHVSIIGRWITRGDSSNVAPWSIRQNGRQIASGTVDQTANDAEWRPIFSGFLSGEVRLRWDNAVAADKTVSVDAARFIWRRDRDMIL